MPEVSEKETAQLEENSRGGVPEVDPLASFFISEEERKGVVDIHGARKMSVSVDESLKLLAFWVADEEYAVDILSIQEIIKVPRITHVPRSRDTVVGVLSLRGTIVPIVDLRLLLKLECAPLTRDARILVMRVAGDLVGFLVDRVNAVVSINREFIEPPPPTMSREISDMLVGVGRVGSQIIIILNSTSVVDVTEGAA